MITRVATQQSEKVRILELMMISRESDRRETSLLRQGTGWFHVGSSGHEALAALAIHMQQGDILAPHYRDRALQMARGMDVVDFALAFLGKRGSDSMGRQMTGHYGSRKAGIWSMPSPTPSHLLPASGIAWAMQMSGQPHLVLTGLGDGGSRQGEFFESLAFSIEKNLPIVYVVHDNHFAISTQNTERNAKFLGLLNEDRLTSVDGRDPVALSEAAIRIFEAVRTGDGPHVLWCDLDRLASHTSSDDHASYRTADDLDRQRQRDPITQFRDQLLSEQVIDATELRRLEKTVADRVARAYEEAEAAEEPRRQDLFRHLTAPTPQPQRVSLPDDRRQRMADAVNAVFHQAIQRDSRVVFFGEDIEDPKGGVFRLTKGLSSRFPDRVHNSPLAESTILGIAAGMATQGMRPIFELQFIDFVGPGWNQLANNLSTLRWRSGGQWTCPAIIYAPCGAYLPGGGIWHSESGGSQLAQLPGIRVAVPGTPDDAAGIFQTALASDDPTIILLPKHLLWKRFPVSGPLDPVGFGSARVVRPGDQVTLVAWGNCVEVAEDAVAALGGEVSVEIIDLRTVQPWDFDSVARSLEKTGRLLVVQEERRSCSIGEMIISSIVRNQETWDMLMCQPQLVSRGDVFIGFNPVYEDYCLPSADDVTNAIRRIHTL